MDLYLCSSLLSIIVHERGLTPEDCLYDRVVDLRWQRFIKPPGTRQGGDRELTHEFYTNLAAIPGNSIYLRGHQIPISPADLNQHLGLPSYPEDSFRQLLQTGVDLDDLTITLTGVR